jgi:hypothetical protein
MEKMREEIKKKQTGREKEKEKGKHEMPIDTCIMRVKYNKRVNSECS